MTLIKTFASLLLAAVVIFASGCSNETNPDGSTSGAATADKQRASGQLKPADEKLAAIYNRSCRSCHTIAATRSPLTGDVEAWKPRLAKGMPTLVDNVVNGFGGMPPFGLCMDCDVDQFEALITFMSKGE